MEVMNFHPVNSCTIFGVAETAEIHGLEDRLCLLRSRQAEVENMVGASSQAGGSSLGSGVAVSLPHILQTQGDYRSGPPGGRL